MLADFMAQHLPDERPGEVWCFALPAGCAGFSSALTGAVTRLPGKRVVVLYSQMPNASLLEGLQNLRPLAFWLARLLVTQPAPQLSRGIRLLEKHYRPDESPARLLARCPTLMADSADGELLTTACCGVEFMPWVDWPGCINTGSFLWLWKQNRHGRIVDSRRVSLRAE